MIRSRLGIKLSGLWVLLMGLMALASGVAQAEVGAAWMVNGTNVTAALPTLLVAKELEGNDAIMLTTLTAKKLEILCTGMTLAIFPEAEGKATEGGATFTGCKLTWKGMTLFNCAPHSSGAAEGTINTLRFHGLIQLHETALLVRERTVLILPNIGETFVAMILGKEGVLNECAAGEKLPVSGKFSVRDANGKFSTEEVTHLMTEFTNLTDLWILNKTAEHKVTLDGSAVLALGAPTHVGLSWSGLPN